MYLTPAQTGQLYSWLAQGVPYPDLRRRMVATWGQAITSPAVTWHRQHRAAEIATLRDQSARDDQRRARDRMRKAAQRVASAPPPAQHCPTCHCR